MKPKIEKREIVKRSAVVDGHRTSVSLEDEFWEALKEVAQRNGKSLNQMITEISEADPSAPNLSSALRVFVFKDALARAASPVTYKTPSAA